MKNCFLFVTHIMNDFIYEHIEKMSSELKNDDVDIYIIYNLKEDDSNKISYKYWNKIEKMNNVSLFEFLDKDVISFLSFLGYKPNEEWVENYMGFAWNQMMMVLMYFYYKKMKSYDNFWYIENDAYFYGDYHFFFEKIKNDATDYISAFKGTGVENLHKKRYKFTTLDIKEEEFINTLNCVFKLTDKAFRYLDKIYKEGNSGYIEWFLPTVISKNPDLTIGYLENIDMLAIAEWRKYKLDGINLKAINVDRPLNQFFHPIRIDMPLSYDPLKGKKVIISFTTIPQRQYLLEVNIYSIIGQTYPVDKIVINIDDNLSDTDKQFYYNLKRLDSRIEVYECDHRWRSCNKLLPTMKMYPDDIIVTLDDDIYYSRDIVKYLVDTYKIHYNCIVTHVTNPIKIDKETGMISYINDVQDVHLGQKQWGKYLSVACLYPPHVFDNNLNSFCDVWDLDTMLELTDGNHDELWFWLNSTLNEVQSISPDTVFDFDSTVVPMKRETPRLFDINNSEEKINSYMKRIDEKFGSKLREIIAERKVRFYITNKNVFTFLYFLPKIKDWYSYDCKIYFYDLDKTWFKLINWEFKKNKMLPEEKKEN